jgi:hypothetical protein
MTLALAITLVVVVGVTSALVAGLLHANVACAGDALVAELDVKARDEALAPVRRVGRVEVDALDLSRANVDLMIAHLDW